jgi:hypothetical protein
MMWLQIGKIAIGIWPGSTHYLIMNATGRPSGIQSPDIFYNN